jgi:hypothetical protein
MCGIRALRFDRQWGARPIVREEKKARARIEEESKVREESALRETKRNEELKRTERKDRTRRNEIHRRREEKRKELSLLLNISSAFFRQLSRRLMHSYFSFDGRNDKKKTANKKFIPNRFLIMEYFQIWVSPFFSFLEAYGVRKCPQEHPGKQKRKKDWMTSSRKAIGY